jgi:DNA primase
VDEAEWLSQSAEALTLRHCAYWMSLRGFPSTTATSTIRIPIPLANRFSVDAVQRLMQRVAERRDL